MNRGPFVKVFLTLQYVIDKLTPMEYYFLTYLLLFKMNWFNNEVIIKEETREELAKMLKITTSRVKHLITSLVKKNMMKRLLPGVYQINTMFFSRLSDSDNDTIVMRTPESRYKQKKREEFYKNLLSEMNIDLDYSHGKKE